MSIEFVYQDAYYTFIFLNGLIIRFDELPECYQDAHIDNLENIISGKVNSSYDIKIGNDINFVIKIIAKNKIQFSICSDFMMHNQDNKYIKSIMEITLNHSDCVDGIQNLKSLILKNIQENEDRYGTN
jgi:hypothetical protein